MIMFTIILAHTGKIAINLPLIAEPLRIHIPNNVIYYVCVVPERSFHGCFTAPIFSSFFLNTNTLCQRKEEKKN